MTPKLTGKVDLSESGKHWELLLRATGTASKGQLWKWVLWVLGVLGIGAGVGSQL